MSGFLRRYTELPFLLHLLKSKQLTLLSPKLWDDTNDSHYIESYKKHKNLQSVLLLCLTEASETYHHWKVFSGNKAGVCIVFDKEKLLSWTKGVAGIRAGSVRYRTLKSVRETAPTLKEMPFLKRHAFRDEMEFRLVFENKDAALEVKNVAFDLETISHVVLNPWLPKSVSGAVKASIQSIDDCKSIDVFRTTLVDNDEWKRIGSSKA